MKREDPGLGKNSGSDFQGSEKKDKKVSNVWKVDDPTGSLFSKSWKPVE
jgi:hypothetical protein